MARLTEHEKTEFLRIARRKNPTPPALPALSFKEFAEFASQISRLAPQPKPVRFEGRHWKL